MNFWRLLCSLGMYLVVIGQVFAQIPDNFQWLSDGSGYRDVIDGEIVEVSLPSQKQKKLATLLQLTPRGEQQPLEVKSYAISTSGVKILIYTNAQRVWRYETRGDYWLLDLATNSLTKIGKDRKESSMMFAKLSPDGKKVAYVSEHNIFVEDVQTKEVKQLTTDGTDRVINGTFDWAYEEEFDCRDGFRWSPDSKSIAYWQLDARKIRNFLMINTTDSIYSYNVPVEYPKVGQTPSPYKIGVVSVQSGITKWMSIPGDPQNTYVPRMEWAGPSNSSELVIQRLNRQQNESILFYVNVEKGNSTAFYTEKDDAWIDIKSRWEDTPEGWDWINGGKEFIWISEKDGWRHAYRVSKDGKKETLITKGAYDLISPVLIDEKNNAYYFMASPDNATQSYLYKASLDGKGGAPLRISPKDQAGTHYYNLSPQAKFGSHSFSNSRLPVLNEWIQLPGNSSIDPSNSISSQMQRIRVSSPDIEFFKVTTKEGIDLDAWMVKPNNFDLTKKYPIVFFVYGEPATSTVLDRYGAGRNRLYEGSMAEDGYIYASVDNRGTPMPKGRKWRKDIYKNIGTINIRDLAGGAVAMFEKFSFIDTSRVAVHGWSGGGSSTINLLFQYPDLFKTGISIAALTDLLTYDNIYEERYMGVPTESKDDYVRGSAITYAKNLKGNLLYIHGTGDDNVHYQNAELLINELVKHNKVFQFMAYPNRSHSIHEGEGTSKHLRTIFTNYLKTYCPPGAR
jgi:dipeptidyl-peptidase-4